MNAIATKAKAKEHPILFSGPMVHAILAGEKTQTRRVIKLPPSPNPLGEWEPTTVGGEGSYLDKALTKPAPESVAIWHTRTGKCIGSRYGVGDHLWVRETWCCRFIDPPGPNGYYDGYWYAATDATPMAVDEDGGQRLRTNGEEASPWISGLRMPREASRLTLKITDIRVETLWRISIEDIIAEGFSSRMREEYACAELREKWEAGWDKINGKRAPWNSNPWVWVITFSKL